MMARVRYNLYLNKSSTDLANTIAIYVCMLILPVAVSHVSGVNEVLYCILYVRIGALLSPIGCQTTEASLALHST